MQASKPSLQYPHSARPAITPIGVPPKGGESLIIDEQVMTSSDRLVYVAAVNLWLIVNVVFWFWWFQADHVVTTFRFILATIGLSYDLTLMPLTLIFFLHHMRRPAPIAPEPDLRVAMLTAIVPSAESIDVLEQTLAGMVAVRYPHDNWVLDEGGDARVQRLCGRYGVSYWTRKGIPEFNQENWPFQAKTKSGNYNSWFHQIGYRDYDYVVQLDTDHIPRPSYLDDVLGYFRDPNVAYVALPSVYRNLSDWTSRGSSEQSQVFQGIMQMGYYGWARTPMIIGSHAAYRLSHLKEIGGFAPSRAEDHLDTLKLAQAGHRGVFVPKVLAEGLGPHNLSDYLAQEHQWAFSIAQVLMKYGRQKALLDVRQRTIFLFSELWYSIYSTSYLLLFLLPLIALMVNEPIVRVPFIEFMIYSLPVTLVSIGILAWAYRRRWLMPGTHFFMSWQGIVLSIARWPIVLIAIANATISLVFRQGRFNYLVTPKGGHALSTRGTLRTIAPYVVLGVVSVAVPMIYATLGRDPDGNAAGYVLFSLMSAGFFVMILIAAAIDFIRVNVTNGAHRVLVLAKSAPILSVAILLLGAMLFSGSVNRERTEAALLYRPDNVEVAVPILAVPVGNMVEVAPDPASTGTSIDEPSPLPSVTSWLFDPSRDGVTFGAYDPSGQLSLISGIDHYFIAWDESATGGIPLDRVAESYAHGRAVLLTIEPWPIDGRSSDTLLPDIASGQYDATIERLASTMRSMQQPILVRFGHEMDMQGLYPWANGDASGYIAAYRHVVDLFRTDGATNVLWVWSPGGQLNAVAFYPGNDYVDYTGVSILEYTRWETEIAQVENPRPLTTLIKEKYDLLAPLGKPMILAELGIDLDSTLKQDRVREMIAALPNFPAIRGVIYFNDQNPVNSVTNDQPQWTLSAADLDTLWNTIANSPWMEQQNRLSRYQITPADPLQPR